MASKDGASASESRASTPNPRFTSSTTDEFLKSQTVGLVHLSDLRKRRAEVADDDAFTSGTSTRDPTFKSLKKKRKAAKKGGLSFGNEDDQDDSTPTNVKKSRSVTPSDNAPTPAAEENVDAVHIKKRLAANTSVGFTAKSMSKNALLREAQTREQLRKEFLVMQEAVKATEFLVPFVFYAGTDIPGDVCRMKKGDFVWLFLDRARKVGAEVSGSDRNRREWARVGVDDLMLVRGDIIIPHHYDFYYFIANKSRGYNGPLFPYSAEPTSATRVDDSPPSTPGGLSIPEPQTKLAKSRSQTPALPTTELEGFGTSASLTKVVDRRWYEKNKHIYPASTWEDFDPTRDYTKGIRKDTEGNAFFFSG